MAQSDQWSGWPHMLLCTLWLSLVLLHYALHSNQCQRHNRTHEIQGAPTFGDGPDECSYRADNAGENFPYIWYNIHSISLYILSDSYGTIYFLHRWRFATRLSCNAQNPKTWKFQKIRKWKINTELTWTWLEQHFTIQRIPQMIQRRENVLSFYTRKIAEKLRENEHNEHSWPFYIGGYGRMVSTSQCILEINQILSNS